MNAQVAQGLLGLTHSLKWRIYSFRTSAPSSSKLAPFPVLSVILNSPVGALSSAPSLRNNFNQLAIEYDILSFKENSFSILNLQGCRNAHIATQPALFLEYGCIFLIVLK